MDKSEASNKEDFRRGSFLEELLPPRVKEPESPKLSQYIVMPQGKKTRKYSGS